MFNGWEEQRIGALEARIAALEQCVAKLDRRTIGQQRFGPIPRGVDLSRAQKIARNRHKIANEITGIGIDLPGEPGSISGT